MLEFLKDNWANILLIIVGNFALATYIVTGAKEENRCSLTYYPSN
jgi:hypothetical protein